MSNAIRSFLTSDYLPQEILDIICSHLAQDNVDSLHSLRLTCKDIAQIPDKYVFRTICLDARVDKIISLQLLSNDARLCPYVKRLSIDASFIFSTLSEEAWTAMIGSYGPEATERAASGDNEAGDTDDENNDKICYEYQDICKVSDKPRYRRQLSDLRNNMNRAERQTAYKQYRLSWINQTMVALMSDAELAFNLFDAIAKFRNLEEVQCCAGACSKYSLSKPFYELRTIRETLATPGFEAEALNNRGPWHSARYAAAAIHATMVAASSGSIRPARLALRTVPWMTLEYLDDYAVDATTSSLLNSTTHCEIPALQHLEMIFDSTDVFGPEPRLDNCLFSLLRRVPNVQSLEIDLDRCGESVSRYYTNSLERLQLPRQLKINHQALRSLRSLTLSRTLLNPAVFEGILYRLSTTLHKVSMSAMSINAAHWVDVFSMMHDVLDIRKTSVTFQGSFRENWFPHEGTDMTWDFRDSLCTCEEKNKCLLLQFSSWFGPQGLEQSAPLTPTAQGGSWVEWLHSGDRCMSYSMRL
ncbi:uncharacterized protein AB675_2942 [Cyphellophora attinorum]|uniref:F-box domain-containing protein n=1 Tax=Cyphellophora attinorum TaxID=1664694 RepID=A0A0N0NIZ4_9EURO|nr:uncharacterized protein AB675_2942 [Phialophora attinorum]KPI36391.1 hypothetical protein AB675_2942 [Phialophora attinorum]